MRVQIAPLPLRHVAQAHAAQANAAQGEQLQPGDLAQVRGQAGVRAFDRQAQPAALRAGAAHAHLGVRQALQLVSQRALDGNQRFGRHLTLHFEHQLVFHHRQVFGQLALGAPVLGKHH